MCGIAGIVAPRLSAERRATAVERMIAAMEHRGPDDRGVASNGFATLGMRRLAIFDPANGRQPMQSPDRRFTLVFNGAIYNFRELQPELSAAGWAFRTQCDTEVLLAALAIWGEGCLERLRGMFAFAVWDARDQSLFLARDPFGIEPLYFRHTGAAAACETGESGGAEIGEPNGNETTGIASSVDRVNGVSGGSGAFLFASEIRALLASGECPADIDPAAVSDYLAWLAVPAPRTIYRGVLSLRPGECAKLQGGQLTLRRAWSFGMNGAETANTASAGRRASVCRNRDEFTRELRRRLEDTIRVHSAADVPVGAFLSGGLDSAAVVGLMARQTGTRLKTFSIAFEETGYSEAREAAEAAAHFGTEHHTRVLTGADVAAEIETLLGSLDQPSGDGLNTYYASAAARAGGVKVALSGLGGDELFGGYPSFRDVPRLARWLPAWRALPPPIRNRITGRLATGDTRRRKLADLLRHARTPHEIGALQRRVFSDTARTALLSPDVCRGESDPFHPELASIAGELPRAGLFELVSAWELRTYMADVLLRDSDIMSMRHSLELRVPLIDRPLVEWLAAQPAAFKSDPRHPKSALFEAVRDVLPPGLASRKKRGFTLPFPIWMKRELRPFLEETFSEASVQRSGLFSRSAVQEMWTRFLSGNDTREWSRVWSLAVLIAFVNRNTAANRAEIAPISVGDENSHKPGGTTSASSVCEANRLEKTEERSIDHPTSSNTGRLNPASSASARAEVETSTSSVSGPKPAVSAKQTRTLLLAPEIFASEGGIPRILQMYLRALCELAGTEGHVRLLALNDQIIDSSDLNRCGTARLEEWRVCSRSKTRFVAAALQMSRNCDRIACGHVAQLPVAWMAQRLNPKLRYYLVAHGIEVWRRFTTAERVALRGAERVLCVSDYTRRELLKNCPLPEGRAVVLHNALDPAFKIVPGRPLGDCPPVILAVTRLTDEDRYKGVEHMIEAMPAIRAAIPDVQLRIVGRGNDVPRLQGIVKRLGMGEAVRFVGYVNDSELSTEMSSCRLFALPSKNEGFGLVFLEAMAHGRPCLGARAGGVPEVITNDTGVLVEYGNVPAIAQASIEALRKEWNADPILTRARHFSFSSLKANLATHLNS